MERRNAIRVITGLVGVLGSRAKAQRTIAEITPGRPNPKAKADHDKCVREREKAAKDHPEAVAWGCFESYETIPGTAVMRLHLTELEAVEVVLNGETKRITRQELWESL